MLRGSVRESQNLASHMASHLESLTVRVRAQICQSDNWEHSQSDRSCERLNLDSLAHSLSHNHKTFYFRQQQHIWLIQSDVLKIINDNIINFCLTARDFWHFNWILRWYLFRCDDVYFSEQLISLQFTKITSNLL